MTEANKNEIIKNHKKIIRNTVFIILCILIAVTVAWMAAKRQFVTVSKVLQPLNVIIAGEGGKDIANINLEYTTEDQIKDNQVILERVICIKSKVPNYSVEVAHTTNIDGLKITLYPATESVEDGITTYPYNKNFPLSGEYLNLDSTSLIADQSGAAYKTTYPEEGDTVQKNAVPLYWKSYTATIEGEKDSDEYYIQYLMLVATWDNNDVTKKEVDLVYLMGANEDQTNETDSTVTE